MLFPSFIVRVGLAALGTTICLAQTMLPAAIRAEVERTPVQSAPVQRTQVDPLTNWATPLYWQPGAAAARGASRAMRPESTASPDASPSSTLSEPAVFVAVTPCRLVDTRVAAGFSPPFGPPALLANTPRTIPVPSSNCGVPAAVAYSINLFVVPAAGALVGYAKAWPDDQPQPNAAVLTDTIAGATVGNSTIVAAGADGGFDVLTLLPTDIVIDINGYFVMPSSLALGAGAAAAPALTFGPDPTTGLFSTGPGTLSVATNGVTALTVNSNGNLDLAGSITKGGALFLHSLGGADLSGTLNTSTGVGLNALTQNISFDNTAMGYTAMQANTTGEENTAVGSGALHNNTAGSGDTAAGYNALGRNTGGSGNTAAGVVALGENTTGSNNTATGVAALGANSTGTENTATGGRALQMSTAGVANTAVGASALGTLVTGSNNTALGAYAGSTTTTGSFNVFIANQGLVADSNLIRIGDSNQMATFIAGISGTTTGLAGALPVVIDANGQLGSVSSSRRVKRDIADMGDTTETLMSLRPVQFRYIAHGPDSPLQYGLIAEEVAEVAPELVARKANGEVETVFYDKVNAMLLNQVQEQQRSLQDQEKTIDQLKSQNESLKERSETLAEMMRRIEARLAALESLGAK